MEVYDIMLDTGFAASEWKDKEKKSNSLSNNFENENEEISGNVIVIHNAALLNEPAKVL
jgi:hypothetical protein